MKKLFKLSLVAALFLVASCNTQVDNNPNYASNLEVAKSFMTAHGTEDLAAQTEMLHDDLLWQPPAYGSEQYGKTEHIEALAMYQTVFDNILFTADNWLPGVLAETGELDGSVRTYGKWTGTHAETGKPFSLQSYHTFDFVDGKIAAGGDYFDLGGFFSSFDEEEEEEEEEDSTE
jgi:ketosteroid isomerase-like protein